MIDISILKNIDTIIKEFSNSKKIKQNDIIKCVKINNFKNNKYFFGITVHLYNNKELTKIFLKILNEKVNYNNILFCFIDDGMDINSINLFESVQLNLDYVLIKFHRAKNIFKCTNDSEIGSFYPLTLYIGNEILKNNCEYLGILHSCTWISKSYFENAESIISKIPNNSILSLFYDNSNKISKTKINNINVFYSNKLNKISLFYKKNLYEKIKKFFTGYDIIINKNVKLQKPIKWNNNINNYLLNNNGSIIITDKCYVQHINLYNKKYNNLTFKIQDLLLKPNKYKHLHINQNFKVNNLNLIHDIVDINNIKIKSNKKFIFQKLEGGLGNQLFMLFNLISLSIDYNLDFSFTFDNGLNIERKCIINYHLAKNQKILKKYYKKYDYEKYDDKFIEKSYLYNKIILPKNKNIYLTGYFQSYKYFWHNKDKIKNYINIDNNKIFDIKNKIKNFNTNKKKLLGIHIRLTDYTEKKDFHFNCTIDYYKNALSILNLKDYFIILFSDDINDASKMMNKVKINFCNSNDILGSNDDEDTFILLSLCDSRICCNSSFSLFSCFFNEIFKFTKKSINIFPNKWFSKNGPDYNINHIVPFKENYITLNQYLNNKINITNNQLYFNNKILKIAVIFFHKNIYKLYQEKWILDCINSILEQENVFFDIYEINYGNENVSIFDNIELNNNTKHQFFVKDYDTHTEAMVFLLKQCFDIDNYDIVFNTNLDDYYHTLRFTYQINNIIENNSYLNSSIWTYIDDNNNLINNKVNFIYAENDNFIWKKIKNFKFLENIKFKKESIKNEILKKNNVINHSAVCFTKKFWNATDKYKNILRYRNDKPFEDLTLWYRALENNVKIDIINQNLIYYRIHNNSIGQKKDKKKTDFTFKKEMNLKDYITGFLFIIESYKDLEIINRLSNINGINLFFYIYANKNINLNLSNNIKYISLIKKFDSENKINNIENIIKIFDVSIIINSEYLYYNKNYLDFNNCLNILYKIQDKNTNQDLQEYKSEYIYNKINKINKI